jgi:hypothetical protein
MAITHSEAAKKASTDAITALVNAGDAAGYFTICDGASVLVTITFSDPAFAAADADGVAAADTTPALSAAASGAGDADNFKVYDSDDTLIWSGTVTATGGGGDMTLDNVSIAVGQTVTINAFTYDAGEA